MCAFLCIALTVLTKNSTLNLSRSPTSTAITGRLGKDWTRNTGNHDNQKFNQVLKVVPQKIEQVLTGVPEISNKFSRE